MALALQPSRVGLRNRFKSMQDFELFIFVLLIFFPLNLPLHSCKRPGDGDMGLQYRLDNSPLWSRFHENRLSIGRKAPMLAAIFQLKVDDLGLVEILPFG